MNQGGGIDLIAGRLQVIADEQIRSDVWRVGPLVARMLSQLRSELSPEQAADVDLALREAVVNAVVHGNQRDRDKRVRVTLAKGRDGELFAIVRDEGSGFEPDRLATPLQGDRLYASGGRGVFLMRSLMKDVTFGDGGRQVCLRIA